MSVNFLTAIDEIYTRFYESIVDHMSTSLSYTPNIYWDDEELEEAPDPSKIYYRVQRFTIKQGQDTFATDVTERQFTTVGLLIISIYTPRSLSNSLRIALDIANYVRSLYVESTASGVWFRDQEIKDRTNKYNENFHHVTVQVTYEHNEVLNNG